MSYIFTAKFKKHKPNSSKKDSKRPKREFPWKKVFIGLGVLCLLGIVAIAGVFAYFAKDLPSPGQINTRQVIESTKIFDRTGDHVLYEIHGEEKRTIIPFDQIPANVKFATLALEDQDFYSHMGVRPVAIARTLLARVFPNQFGVAGGGSTITQQFIKHSVLTSEKRLSRKIKEVILSLEVERKFEKNEILEMYLNEIPYGSNAYGIESAAQTFFNKPAIELTLDESALLASLPQAPSRYSPFGSNTELLKGRQENALQVMAHLGYISQEEADAAKAINIFEKIKPKIENIHAPHFVMYVKEYLEEKYGRELVEEGGLNVYTTLDWDKQQIAEQAVREGVEENVKKWNAENASLVAVDPKTGQILAMVGSRNFFDEEIDGQVNVSIRDRQPGSSMKPYVFLTAFMKGYTPETVLFDVPTDFEVSGTSQDYSPQNYDGTFRGPTQIKDALGLSLNIPAVKALYLVGVPDAITTAKNLGITTLNEPGRYGLSLVLGGGEVKLVDHVAAYATLANNGIKHEKTALLRVQDASGNVLEEYQNSGGIQIVEEKYIAMLNHILSTNDYRAPAFGEQNPLRFDHIEVAAKTGTTNEYRDGWTVGYSRSLAAGVWAGNNDNSPMKPGAAGANVAGHIFHAFMERSLENATKESFPKYEPDENIEKAILKGELDIEEDVKVCEIPGNDDTYCLANKYCLDDDIKKRSFADVHNILYYVDRNDPQGERPENPKSDFQYKEWEKGVKKYYEDKDKYIFDEIPEDECKADDFSKYKPEILIETSSTSNKQTLSLKVDTDAPYGIEEIRYYIEDKHVKTVTEKPYSTSYTAKETENNSSIILKAVLVDKNGNEAVHTKSINFSF